MFIARFMETLSIAQCLTTVATVQNSPKTKRACNCCLKLNCAFVNLCDSCSMFVLKNQNDKQRFILKLKKDLVTLLLAASPLW